MEARTEMMEKRLIKLLKNTSMSNAVPFQWKKENMKVLVLAPHYDDDVISCGGVMHLHCQRQDIVDIVYFTDGSASQESGLDKNELIRTRQIEAQKSCMIIGKGINTIHLKKKDGELQRTNDLVELLTRKINEENYNRIYFPSPFDIHKDHFIVSTILNSALDKVNHPCELVIYEFWNPLESPNRFFHLEGLEEIKFKALSEHKSQTKYVDYVRLARRLNQHRGEMIGYKSCEAFQTVSKYELESIIESSLIITARRK